MEAFTGISQKTNAVTLQKFSIMEYWKWLVVVHQLLRIGIIIQEMEHFGF